MTDARISALGDEAMDHTDWREVRYCLKWAAVGLAIVAVLVLALLFAMPAHSHDWKRPDLDQWYGSLRNPNSPSDMIRHIGCCSQDDCHETEAEQRGADWWARLATHVRASDGKYLDWKPGPWVKIPPEAILDQHDNPTGSAVICHSMSIGMDGEISPAANTVWCFIRPTES